MYETVIFYSVKSNYQLIDMFIKFPKESYVGGICSTLDLYNKYAPS